MKKYDVVIIGAGSAGLNARREVAKSTDNYIVADPGILGTTCARVGCMPSKVLIQVAEDFHRRLKFNEEGLVLEGSLNINGPEIMKHVRKLRDRFVRAVTSGMESWQEQKLVRKKASFKTKNTLMIGEEEVETKKVVIATGSSPVIPDIFKDFFSFCVTTDEFFELEDLPKSMAIIGTGVIGMELGQALNRLGIETLTIGRRRNICRVSDPELNEYVCKKFENKMPINFSGIKTIQLEEGKLLITLKDGNHFKCEKVLLTAGRKPNLTNLNLEVTGVTLDERGMPKINPETMRVENSDYYFAGDITGEKAILHEASDEGRVAGFNAVQNEDIAFSFRTPLEVTFTDPNIVFVGKKYEVLKKEGISFEEGKVLFEGQGRSIIKLKEEGMLKVYGDKKTGELLGCEMYAPDGEHLGHLLSWAIAQKLNVSKLLSLPFYHPVVEEGLRTALRDLANKCEDEKGTLEIFKK